MTNLPNNPGDKFYATICFVCQEEAKPGQQHIRNYGAIVCFSCRQFFRRAHQKTRSPNFVCTFGDSCTITVESRRRCQKCRHQRCLVAGMTPQSVLTVEEKDVRFRKLKKKKRKLLAKIAKMNSRKRRYAKNATANTGENVAEPVLKKLRAKNNASVAASIASGSSQNSSVGQDVSGSSRGQRSSRVGQLSPVDSPTEPVPSTSNGIYQSVTRKYNKKSRVTNPELQNTFKVPFVSTSDSTKTPDSGKFQSQVKDSSSSIEAPTLLTPKEQTVSGSERNVPLAVAVHTTGSRRCLNLPKIQDYFSLNSPKVPIAITSTVSRPPKPVVGLGSPSVNYTIPSLANPILSPLDGRIKLVPRSFTNSSKVKPFNTVRACMSSSAESDSDMVFHNSSNQNPLDLSSKQSHGHIAGKPSHKGWTEKALANNPVILCSHSSPTQHVASQSLIRGAGVGVNKYPQINLQNNSGFVTKRVNRSETSNAFLEIRNDQSKIRTRITGLDIDEYPKVTAQNNSGFVPTRVGGSETSNTFLEIRDCTLISNQSKIETRGTGVDVDEYPKVIAQNNSNFFPTRVGRSETFNTFLEIKDCTLISDQSKVSTRETSQDFDEYPNVTAQNNSSFVPTRVVRSETSNAYLSNTGTRETSVGVDKYPKVTAQNNSDFVPIRVSGSSHKNLDVRDCSPIDSTPLVRKTGTSADEDLKTFVPRYSGYAASIVESTKMPHLISVNCGPHTESSSLRKRGRGIGGDLQTTTKQNCLRNISSGDGSEMSSSVPMVEDCGLINDWPEHLESKVNLILQSHTTSMVKFQNQSSQNLFSKIAAFKTGDYTSRFCLQDFVMHLAMMYKQFNQFALMQSQFTRLPWEDQYKLLAHNTPLYIQLCFGCSFINTISNDMFNNIVKWSKGTLNPTMFKHPVIELCQVIKSILKPGADISSFLQFLVSLRALRLRCPDVKSVLAYIILFNSNEKMGLKNEKDLEDVQLINHILFSNCRKKSHSRTYSMQDMVKTLQNLHQFVSCDVDWNIQRVLGLSVSNVNNTQVNLSTFTSDERSWIDNHLQEVKKSVMSVSFSHEDLKEFLMFTCGFTLSQNFRLDVHRHMAERALRLIIIHPEFKSKSLAIKRQIWEKSGPVGVAFQIIQKDCAPTGLLQLKDEFIGLETLTFEQLCLAIFSGCTNKKKNLWLQKSFMQQIQTGIKHISLENLLQSHLVEKFINTLNFIKSELRPLLADPTLSTLLLMISMIQPSASHLPRMTQLYHLILLKYLETNWKSTEFFHDSPTLVKKIVSSIHSLANCLS